jgi:hypothetical protein
MVMSGLRGSAIVVGTAFIFGACSSTLERVPDSEAVKGFAFLQANTVTRQEIQGRIGAPAATYENGRIATYPLTKSDGRFAPGGDHPTFTLVVIYGQDGMVERWSLVDRERRK